MLSTRIFGYDLVVRINRGEGRWEVLAEGQSLACSTEWESVKDAVEAGAGAAATLVIDELVATGVAPWRP